jgi:hypothetical protein
VAGSTLRSYADRMFDTRKQFRGVNAQLHLPGLSDAPRLAAAKR